MSATDIITIDEAKRYLGIDNSDTAKDAELATYISGVSAALDGYSGPVVQRTITDEVHPGGTSLIELNYWPIASITTVTEYVDTTATVLSAHTIGGATTVSNYYLDPITQYLYRQSGGYPAAFGRSGVKVTYVAGRFADTNAVAEPYKLAACLALADAWRSTIGGGNAAYGGYEGEGRITYALPYQAQSFVERRPPRVA